MSKLQTSYLAISGNAGAGIVRVPYEHAEFERRLKDLRYETGDYPSPRYWATPSSQLTHS
jgi:hypothetical protein